MSGSSPLSCAADAPLSPYSKLLLASREQVLGLVREERMALQAQLCVEDEREAQACFIQAALQLLQVCRPQSPSQRCFLLLCCST